jgi:hypothetical protein
MEKRIKERIQLLKTELEDLIKDANTKVAAYRAAIGELEALLAPVESPEVKADKTE